MTEAMQGASEQIERTPETLIDTPYCFGIMGNTGAHHRVRSMWGVMAETYGEENVKLWNSYLSQDAKEPHRFGQMATELGGLIESGRPLTVFLYSFGAVEFTHAMDRLRSMRPELFEDPAALSKMSIKLVDPTGFFRGVTSAAGYLKEAAELGSLALLRPGSWHEAVDSMILYPPKNMSNEEVSLMLRELYSEHSHVVKQPDVPVIPFGEPERHYWEKLDVETRSYLEEIDRYIGDFRQQGNNEMIPVLMSLRSKALRQKQPWEILDRQYRPKEDHREAVYSGQYYKEPRMDWSELSGVRQNAQALLGLLPLLRRAFFGAQVDRYEAMIQRGASIEFLTPEFSVFTPQAHLISEATHRVMERFTHASQTPQPESIYREALK